MPTELSDAPETITSDTVPVSIFVDALKLTLGDIQDHASKPPPPSTPTFTSEAAALLTKLRHVQATATDAARNTKGPGIALLLSDVRRTYTDLILRASRAPDAALSHRLYAARHLAELTIEETANAAGVDTQTITDAEADRPIPATAAAALETLIAQLTRREPQPPATAATSRRCGRRSHWPVGSSPHHRTRRTPQRHWPAPRPRDSSCAAAPPAAAHHPRHGSRH